MCEFLHLYHVYVLLVVAGRLEKFNSSSLQQFRFWRLFGDVA